MQTPEKDEYSKTRQQMTAHIDVCMGGRVAEELIFGAAQVFSVNVPSPCWSAFKLAAAMLQTNQLQLCKAGSFDISLLNYLLPSVFGWPLLAGCGLNGYLGFTGPGTIIFCNHTHVTASVAAQVTSGARSDFQQATREARHMVTECGMSEDIGPMFVENTESPDMRRRIDSEVSRILREAYSRVKTLLVSTKSPILR